MSTVLREFAHYLTNPISVAGLFLLAFFLIGRAVIPKETLRGWRRAPANRFVGLVISNYFLPILGAILVSGGVISMKTFGPRSYEGFLRIAGGQAFLIPDPNQSLPDSILMMMRDIPPGGTPNERINSAASYFTLTLQKVNGDRIEVTGSVAPFGSVQVLVVDQ